jgi:hypothetical protein
MIANLGSQLSVQNWELRTDNGQLPLREDDAGAVGGFVFYGLQGFVGLGEGEGLDLGFYVDFGG